MVKLPKLKIPHINIKLVTKVLIGVAVVLSLGGLITATVKHYQAEQITKTNQRQTQLDAAYQAGYDKGTASMTSTKTKYELLKLECQKGQKSYAALTAFQKRTAQPVNCEQSVLQL